MRPILLAVLTLVVAFVGGLVLMLADRTMLGVIAMLVGLPAAFIVWLTANDRA